VFTGADALVVVVVEAPDAMTQAFEILLPAIVTSPVFAKAAPWSDVDVPSVTLEYAIIVPTKVLEPPIIAPPALVTQKTLQELAPFSRTTLLPVMVVSAPATACGAWKIQTEAELP
jgi:hypothetical protein